MKKSSSSIALAVVAALLGTAAWAAPPQTQEVTQRDVNQQDRIEQGLQSGQLSTRETGQLEKDESHLDKMEARDLRNGKLSPQETARINAAQNRVSHQIYADKHNGTVGNPDSASSQRMQKDVQRDANQESRIKQGESSGSLTNREAGHLERGQAHTDRREGRAGANGHVGAAEQRGIQRAQNRQSRHIYRKKHNA
ncbi:MAG TPA: hypothetical protein VN750_08075 [Steroidobacteraceae bacterium]|nr:hypothetical protein [Steroidobacteraceae bacterium]